MRYFLYSTLHLLLLIGCNNSSATLNTLDEIDKVMNSYPDRALLYLKNINQNDLTNKKLKAKYALLYSQALDKNYIDIISDSIIRIAVDYYSKCGTPQERAKSFYYLGTIHRNANEVELAAKAYLESIFFAKQDNNYVILGLAYNALGQAYYYQKSYPDATKCFNEAITFFKGGGDTKNYLYSLQSVVQSLRGENKLSEAIENSKKAIELSLNLKDTITYKNICRVIASLYLEKGDVTLAKEIIIKAFNKSNYTYKEYPLLIDIFIKSNESDSVALYANCALKNESRYNKGSFKVGLYQLLSNAEKSTGNHKLALEYSNIAARISDSIHKIEKQNYITELEQKHKIKGVEKAYKQSEKYNRLLFLSVIFIVILACLIILFLIFNGKRNKNIDLKNQRADYNTKIKDLDGSLISRIQIMQAILDIAYYNSSSSIFKARMGDFMDNLRTRNKICDLVSGVVCIYQFNNDIFCETLSKKYNLTEEEISICCFINMGFKNHQISQILKKEEGTLNNKRSVILNKLHSCNSHKNKLDLILQEIKYQSEL